MGTKERRNAEKAEMKQKIIDASVELIEQQGYDKLSIRKIAAKIEYSPTTIYLYYKDKAEIIADMSEALYRKVERSAAEIIRNLAMLPADQLVHSIFSSFINSLCSEPEMAKAIMYSGTNVIFANENNNDTPVNSGITMLDDLLAEGISQNIFRPNAAATSWMIISALIGFVMSVIENKLYMRPDFGQLAEGFVDLIMGGIRQ